MTDIHHRNASEQIAYAQSVPDHEIATEIRYALDDMNTVGQMDIRHGLGCVVRLLVLLARKSALDDK